MKVSYQRFWREVTRDGKEDCALAGAAGRPCSNVRDAHHFVPKQRIKLKLGRGSDACNAALTDVRNGVCLCRTHHDLVEVGFLESPRPQLLDFFIADHGVHPREKPARLIA
jgi:hypothetical protein